MRTLIYARYSSTLQNDRSIEDQVAACRARAEREGWPVLAVHEDRAVSGAAGTGEAQRPGLNAMMARVEAGGVDQVLVDTSSRLARDLGDADRLRKLINYCGARLFSLGDGEIDALKGTIKALFDEQARREIAHNVRRGQAGNVAAGRSSGSIAYGYRRVSRLDDRGELVRGLREIDPDQADVVRRIFGEYAQGQSAHAITMRLNQDGIPAPKSGSAWRASTLIAHRTERTGMLSNPIYVGRLLYGRTKAVTDPRTRTTRMRLGDGVVTEGAAPHLRILDDALWREVQDQLARRSTTRPERQRRPKHVLSGLGECGVCGGAWVAIGGGYWGCSRGRQGACANNRMIATHLYERRVLADLRGAMLAPEAVAEYVREYHLDMAREEAELTRERGRVERRLDEARRKVERLVSIVAEGGREFAEIRDLLAQASDDRDRLARELAGMDALPVLRLHPGLADRYRREVDELDLALAGEHTRLEAIPRLRRLISRIVVTPSSKLRGVELEVIRAADEVLTLAMGDRRTA